MSISQNRAVPHSSLRNQVARNSITAIEPRIGIDWEGKLDDWIDVMLHKHETANKEAKKNRRRNQTEFQDWSFPTDQLCEQYLSIVKDRDECEIRVILRAFLFENARFAPDDRILKRGIREGFEFLDGHPEYKTRLLEQIGGRASPQPGVRWALDLLPAWPQAAIDAISAYLLAHDPTLPDGRAQGLCDAISIIRARWLEPAEGDRASLHELSPRDLECMVAALYRSLGYTAILTPESKDGGRDVIVERNTPGRFDHALVECKAYTKSVGVKIARELLGVVSDEKANRGVLVTTGKFTRDAHILAERNPRLELVDGGDLVALFCKRFGSHWRERREELMRRASNDPAQAKNDHTP
ncbi:restriction endonuclease [Streptomyces sp. A1-5]|uniref:restriction endonuclease n=1 Tax=Streptomyces sp. A1-5 TaxID=2738410 RepID=UPI001F1E496A|nr:restriction endonuclease [Streptomyces sp. A1-5]UJB41663.1 restriction endonuclease [Streptomyces sp. A1-5]